MYQYMDMQFKKYKTLEKNTQLQYKLTIYNRQKDNIHTNTFSNTISKKNEIANFVLANLILIHKTSKYFVTSKSHQIILHTMTNNTIKKTNIYNQIHTEACNHIN